MNWLDVAIALIIVTFTLSAFSSGLIREVVTLVSAVTGVVFAGLFYDDLARDVLVFIHDKDSARFFAFLALLGSVYLTGQLIAMMLKQMASLLLLGWVDRAGGAAFGFLKGLVVVEVLLILLVTFPQIGLREDIDGSALASVFLDAIPLLLVLLPEEFERAVDAFVA
jgi:membrane protein required for colicin V production